MFIDLYLNHEKNFHYVADNQGYTRTAWYILYLKGTT